MRKKTVQNQKLYSLNIQENIGCLNGSLVKGLSFETSIPKPLIFLDSILNFQKFFFFPSSKFRFF